MILMILLLICIIIHWYIINFKYVRKLKKEIYFSNAKSDKLENEVNRLNNIIKNNEYNDKLDYNNIQYISSEKRIAMRGDKIVAKEQYTTDVTKAKNFVKYKNDYVEYNNDWR